MDQNGNFLNTIIMVRVLQITWRSREGHVDGHTIFGILVEYNRQELLRHQ